IPVQPQRAEIEQEQHSAAKQAQIAIQTREAAGVNGSASLRRRQAHRFLAVQGFDDSGGYSIGHDRASEAFSGEADHRLQNVCVTDSGIGKKYGSEWRWYLRPIPRIDCRAEIMLMAIYLAVASAAAMKKQVWSPAVMSGWN